MCVVNYVNIFYNEQMVQELGQKFWESQKFIEARKEEINHEAIKNKEKRKKKV